MFLKSLAYKSAISIQTFNVGFSYFFASAYKKPAQCAKSLEFLIQRAYQRTVPVPLQKRRTVPMYRTLTILSSLVKAVEFSTGNCSIKLS